MVLWAVTLSLVALSVNGERHCHQAVTEACSNHESPTPVDLACNSTSVSLNFMKYDLSRYVATLVSQNWNYLLMSTHFGSYRGNRKGFSRLFRKLADQCWEDAVAWVEFMAMRGVNMDYTITPKDEENLRYYSMNELESLAVALDMQKTLADQLNEVNRLSSRDRRDYYDARTMHFIEDKFLDKYVNATRKLSGHVNELHNILKDSEDPSLVFYMYDDHLKEVVAAADCKHAFSVHAKQPDCFC